MVDTRGQFHAIHCYFLLISGGVRGVTGGQLPPVFNRRECVFAWGGNAYPNRKLKERLGWQCRVPMREALDRYFEYQRNG